MYIPVVSNDECPSNSFTINISFLKGVCQNNNYILENIIECSIEKKENEIIATPLDKTKTLSIKEDTLVSMNLFGFTPSIFTYLEEKQKSSSQSLATGSVGTLCCLSPGHVERILHYLQAVTLEKKVNFIFSSLK